MTTILLARHGETDWNRERRFQGQADPELNAAGLAQARALALHLADDPPAAIYASDLRRARVTAEIVGEAVGLPVVLEPRLREIDIGEWSGLLVTEIAERFPEPYERWRRLEAHGWTSGETYHQLADRVAEALLDIADRHPEGRVLAVTHGGVIRAAAAAAAGIPYAEARRSIPVVANCALSVFAVEERALRAVD